MNQAGAWPWARSYPAGLSPDVTLDTWPVPSLIDRGAREFGDNTAFVFRDATLNYRELKAEIDRAASAFLASGIGKGARWRCCCRTRSTIRSPSSAP